MAGTYSILERIAVGGMGEVFLARQTGIGGFQRTVVLKRLLPDAEGDDEAMRRLLDEARIAGALLHENVVSIIEVGEGVTGDRRGERGGPFLALEYVHGDNAGVLRRRAKRDNVEISALAAARIVRDAARGLHHAHTAKGVDGAPLHIVHRDVAPKNIFVRADGVSKIGDFGIAKSERKLAATATGSVPGTLAYMSPEQVRGDVVGPLSDQFSLGIVLWELLCAYRLFKAASPAETVQAIATKKLRAPSKMNAEAWPLDEIVLRMLERDPRKRFADLAAAVAAMEEALPEVATDVGRHAVETLVERLLGADLRLRERNIEQGPQAAETTLRVPRVGAFGEDEVPQTSEPTGTSPELPTRRERPTKRMPRVVWAAAAAIALVVGGGAVGATRTSDDDRTRAYLRRAQVENALIDREVLRAMAQEAGVDAQVATVAAEGAAGLAAERLAILAAHWRGSAADRRRADARVADQERALEDQARALLAPLGETLAVEALDMWAYDASVPAQWLPPSSDLEVVRDLKAGGVEMMRAQETMRRRAVDALVARLGADPVAVQAAVGASIRQREGLIVALAGTPIDDVAALRLRIEALEDDVRARLVAKLGVEGGAVASLALWWVPRTGAHQPLFDFMPSTRAARAGGDRVAER